MDPALLIVVAFVVAIIVLLVVRSRRKPPTSFVDAMTESRQQRLAEQAKMPWGTARLVVAPDVSFASLDESLSRLGARQSPPGPAHEPERATWANQDSGIVIHYLHHARTGLRGLELHSRGDEGARGLVQDIVNGLYLSTMEHRAVQLLESQARHEIVLGLDAVEFLGRERMTEAAPPRLDALRAHPDPEIAAWAGRLLAQWGAPPVSLAAAPAPVAPIA